MTIRETIESLPPELWWGIYILGAVAFGSFLFFRVWKSNREPSWLKVVAAVISGLGWPIFAGMFAAAFVVLLPLAMLMAAVTPKSWWIR